MLSHMALAPRKGSQPEVKTWFIPQKIEVDEELYRSNVLRLPYAVAEDDVDERIAHEAQDLGLLPLPVPPEIEAITSSFSATTIASESNNPSSILSQSTAPTSCSSSEYRPMTQSSIMSETSEVIPGTPSILSEVLEKKRDSGFRRGFRKMAGFKKRRSIVSSSTLTSINSDSTNTHESDRMSIKSGMKSPGSIKSSKSSWSSPMSANKPSYEHHTLIDHDALKRSMECKEMLNLRTTQLDERLRFLEFQESLVRQIRAQRDAAKAQKASGHDGVIEEQEKKNEKAVEDLEARQLEEEMKMLKDHDLEKRTVMIRLRHMEAYCQNPTPPPTPVLPSSGRLSLDSALPERKVTDKDYHNLAQQYRERDTMENLHAAKINVLRGKQKKAVENFIRKKEKEVDGIRASQRRELNQIDLEFAGQEAELRTNLDVKRTRLEARWRVQALIARTKAERATGQKHAALPDVSAFDERGSNVRVI